VYYEDDGASYNYEKGEYYQRTIRYDPLHRSIILDRPEGSMATKFRCIRLVLHGFDCGKITWGGGGGREKSIPLSDQRYSFLSAGASEQDGTGYPVKTAVFINDNQAINLQY